MNTTLIADEAGETWRDDPRNSPIYAAYHEAGHAVLLINLGLPFRYVTLRPRGTFNVPGVTGELLGAVVRNPRRRRSQWTPDSWLAEAAGPIAEIYLGEQDTEDTLYTLAWVIEEMSMEGSCWFSSDDVSSAHELRGVVGGRSFDDPSITRRLEEAVEAVVLNWPAISALAAALLASPRALTRRQCVEVVAPHLVHNRK